MNATDLTSRHSLQSPLFSLENALVSGFEVELLQLPDKRLYRRLSWLGQTTLKTVQCCYVGRMQKSILLENLGFDVTHWRYTQHESTTMEAVAIVEAMKRKKVTEASKARKKPMRRSERLLKGVSVIELVHGDTVLAGHVHRAHKSADDRPLVFDWNDANVAAFWTKAVDYGSVEGSDAPPTEVNGGVHLSGEPTQDNVRDLKLWILQYVSTSAYTRSHIGGRKHTLGLRCSQETHSNAIMALGQVGGVPWFIGVIQHGNPSGPLATLLRPRTDSPHTDYVPYAFAKLGSILWA
jgi:hypothetical protein